MQGRIGQVLNMFEDAQEFAVMKEGMFPAGNRSMTKLLQRCTANSATTIADTYIPSVCYDSRGCCNTFRAMSTPSTSLEQPVSSSTTLDARVYSKAALVEE